MPDWIEVVKSRLGALGLEPEREAEIVAELAQHLEDTYEDCRQQGWSDPEAAEQARHIASDWKVLRRDIRRAVEGEDQMNHRTRVLWIPGLVTLTSSMLWLWGIQLTGFQPYFFSIQSATPAYWPWLVVLPAIGAFGAWWSRRAGGKRWERSIAAVFPAVSFTALLVMVFPVALIVDGHIPVSSQLLHLGGYFWAWAIVPGVALHLGAFPFLRNASGNPRVSGGTVEAERGSSSPDRKPTGLFCWSS